MAGRASFSLSETAESHIRDAFTQMTDATMTLSREILCMELVIFFHDLIQPYKSAPFPKIDNLRLESPKNVIYTA